MPIDAANLIKTIDTHRQKAAADHLPYWAVVSAISGSLVAVSATNATTASQELFARTEGVVAVGDVGICMPVRGGDWLFVRQETADTAYRRLPIEVDTTSPTKAATTNIATFVTLISTTITPSQYGTYGCMVWGSASLWRSVASGDKRLQLAVGGTTHEVISATTDGSVMTAEHTMICRILRDSSVAMTINAGNPSVTISLGYRGNATAGTTNIVNAEISGHLYRIS